MSYSQKQKITNASGAANYNLGNSLSIDGYYILVGEQGNNTAHIYKRDINGSWNNIKTLIPGYTGFGCSVSIDGDYGAIGAKTNNASQGIVSIYKNDAEDNWSDSTTVVASDAEAGDQFGYSVDIDGIYLVIGAPYKSNNKGAVYVYKRTSTNTWIQDLKIIPLYQSNNDYFGYSVSISGTTIVIGARGDGDDTGAVYIFELNNDTEEWEESKKLFASDGKSGDQFGCSVSIDGDYFVVGAKYKTSLEGDFYAGAVYVFRYTTSWNQVDKLEGINETSYVNNNFGSSVHINGDYIAIGSPEARNTGVIDIFHKKRSWGHLIKLIPSDISSNDGFGSSVAVFSSYIVGGSPDQDTVASNAGAIYVFEDTSIKLRLAQEFDVNEEFLPSKASIYLKRVGENSNNYWSIYNDRENVIDSTNFSTIDKATTSSTTTHTITEFQTLTASDGEDGDYFGVSVSVDGDYAVIGAYNEGGKGAAYLFKKNSVDQWTQIKKLEDTGGAANSYFGLTVLIDGNDVFIGATGAGGGIVYIFSKDQGGIDNWGEARRLTNGDAGASDEFGRSISIDGNVLAIGAPGHDSPVANGGAVYIFTRDINNPSNEWTEFQKLQSTDIQASDTIGWSVSVDKNYIAVGARGENGRRGAVYLFEKDINDPSGIRWNQIKKITISDGAADDYFGYSVVVSGNYIYGGANQANTGKVYIFHKDQGGIDNWGELQRLTPSDGETSDYFGISISVNGDYIIIGSSREDEKGIDAGAVYTFYKNPYLLNSEWTEIKKTTADNESAGDYFGTSVSSSGNVILVGSYNEDTLGIDAGAAYIFHKSVVFEGRNIIMFEDEIGGFTGNGYMIVYDESVPPTDFGIINYPIKAVEADIFYLWLRVYPSLSNSFQMEILIDGNISKTIDLQFTDPSVEGWTWTTTRIVLPDTNEHILGIKIKENGGCIDKIYIDKDDAIPYADGPVYSESPYVTVHMKLYESNGEPVDPLLVYDYKNSIDDVIQDDWYNFNIKVLGNNNGYTEIEDFTGSYFLVLATSGGNYDNFILWEMNDNDEYLSFSSGLKL